MDLPIQDECTVSGTLGLVLRMSRIFGQAPLKFERVRKGWSSRVSFAANLYGVAILCLIFFTSLGYLVCDYKVERHLSMHFKTSSDTVAIIFVIGMIQMLSLAATFSGSHRMQSMITSLAHMQKINADLYQYGPQPSFKFKSMTLIPIYSYIGACLNYGMFFGLILYVAIFEKKYEFLRQGLHATVNIVILMNKLLILQVTLILAAVPASLHHLNYCLWNLLLQIRNQSLDSKIVAVTKSNFQQNSYHTVFSYKSINSIIYSLEHNKDTINKPFATMAATVKRLRTLYGALCCVVKHINDSHGTLLAVVIAYHFILLTITLYNIIIAVRSIFEYEIPNRVFILAHIFWLMMQITDLVMIIEPCHRAYEEMEHTKRLIGRMLLFTPPEHHEVIHELELFYKHLMHDVVYTPMGIFHLNRTIIATVFGSITTYLVVMVKL